MENSIYGEDNLAMDWPVLAAFALGFLVVGIGIGITIFRACLPWFLSQIRVDNLRAIIEETGQRYEAKWKRERERHKRLRWHATGKHLMGVPLQKSAVDEVREQMTEVKPPLESRRL